MAKTSKQITVAAIPSSDGFLNSPGQEGSRVWRVVLNVGSEDGVRLGQGFVIYSVGAELTDPSTGESLGNYEVVRGRGEVVHVQEKMCTIRSTETTMKATPSINALAVAAGYPETTKSVEIPFTRVLVGDLARRI